MTMQNQFQYSVGGGGLKPPQATALNVLQHWIFALERLANNHFKVLSQINLKVHSCLVTDSSICIELGFVLENCINR